MNNNPQARTQAAGYRRDHRPEDVGSDWGISDVESAAEHAYLPDPFLFDDEEFGDNVDHDLQQLLEPGHTNFELLFDRQLHKAKMLSLEDQFVRTHNPYAGHVMATGEGEQQSPREQSHEDAPAETANPSYEGQVVQPAPSAYAAAAPEASGAWYPEATPCHCPDCVAQWNAAPHAPYPAYDGCPPPHAAGYEHYYETEYAQYDASMYPPPEAYADPSAPYYPPEPYRSEPYQQQHQAQSPPPSGPPVMCCYHKSGRGCNKGDRCWYSHEGLPETPCHYGALCKAGHAHLVRQGGTQHPPVPARTRQSNTAAAVNARRQRAYYYHRPRPQQSATFQDAEFPCPYCASQGTVATQQFPLYIGSEISVGVRGHCTACRRTFALN